MNALALGLLLGVGLTVKYSGVLLEPMMGLALLVRACLCQRHRRSGRGLVQASRWLLQLV